MVLGTLFFYVFQIFKALLFLIGSSPGEKVIVDHLDVTYIVFNEEVYHFWQSIQGFYHWLASYKWLFDNLQFMTMVIFPLDFHF